MGHIAFQVVFFVACYGIAITFHFLRHREALKSVKTHTKASLFSGLAAALPEATRDFTIHIVLYSGLIIPGH